MSHRIARHLFEPLLRILLPGTGRHRLSARTREDQSPAHAYADGPPLHRPESHPLRGEDHALVRPYLVAHERSQEAMRRRPRRRALWLAVHGIDAEPRVIHRAEAAA